MRKPHEHPWSSAGAKKSGQTRGSRKLLKRQCPAPRVMITDKLESYAAAKKEIMPSVEHRQHKGLNNRAENHTSRPDDENGR
jgi:hypothetical protein